ncbi:MAG: phosphoribosylformylglycinamidine cyclo-ligase [Candidatus Bathyarchaeota archaeon]|nr:MAG: phosphoribosylformylglycinamidine cyclo-ligase [Candidatus Bathyarchaeota archaeon]
MSSSFTYAKAGVDRELRARSKVALKVLEQTYKHSRYGEVVQLPYGNIFPIEQNYFDLVIEGVGTKVLLAQLANKYDTIGIDAVALAANDVIRSGATPLALADNIHAHVSDPKLVVEWIQGIAKGANEAGCVVPSGEIGDVAEVIRGLSEGIGFDMVVACIGELDRNDIVLGNNLGIGDVVIGLRSSGVHSNGMTLARKILFRQWGGKYEPFEVPEGFDRELVYEVLKPMAIYVKPFLNAAKKCEIKGAVHITGDAYMKFDRLMLFSKGVGFEFDNFKPQPIFGLVQKAAEETRVPVSDKEMLRTFNMGWGFAIVVDSDEKDAVIDSFEKDNIQAEQIGKVNDSRKIVASYKGKKILLK